MEWKFYHVLSYHSTPCDFFSVQRYVKTLKRLKTKTKQTCLKSCSSLGQRHRPIYDKMCVHPVLHGDSWDSLQLPAILNVIKLYTKYDDGLRNKNQQRKILPSYNFIMTVYRWGQQWQWHIFMLNCRLYCRLQLIKAHLSTALNINNIGILWNKKKRKVIWRLNGTNISELFLHGSTCS